MSRENYIKSKEIAMNSFESILMGFMRVANTQELNILKYIYPSVWDELQTRYNAPGGYLEGERNAD